MRGEFIMAENQVNKLQEVTNYITYGQLNILNDFRKLWSEQTIFTRSYIDSTDVSSPDLQAVSDRLMKVPDQMYMKLEVFFGPIWAERYINVLQIHIVLLERLSAALKKNDQETADATTKDLYQNADEMADILARMNVFWSKGQWGLLLTQYVNLMISMMVARFSGDYERAIQVYDRFYIHALIIADYMAAGIMQYVISTTPLVGSLQPAKVST